MRKAGVSTLAAANQYLQQVYLPLWQRRFTCLPASSQDAHRPLLPTQSLDAILSRQEKRHVSNDYTLRFAGQLWQIERDQVRPGLRDAWVTVESRLDGCPAGPFPGALSESARMSAAGENSSGSNRPSRSSGSPSQPWQPLDAGLQSAPGSLA